MTNKRQKSTHPEKTNLKKLLRLQPLNLEQLDGVCGANLTVELTGGDMGGVDT